MDTGEDSHGRPPKVDSALSETIDCTGSKRSRGEEQGLQRGETIGRFVVLERIGAGGMGVVYATYDPKLDRRLAVKLLLDEPGNAVRRARLWREAQAMARLNHPNVCVVHDVGTWQDQVYVAMEFVDGHPLGQWLELEPRSEAEVLGVFIEAGRGLVAAHQAGLVHRDFKPDNVVVGAERVRVMDFGLARQAGGDPVPRPVLAAVSDSIPLDDPLSRPITRAGSVTGTPAYMSPEQHYGMSVGAGSDQFSFCVALWEALYGERPFEGKTLHEVAVAVTQGEVRDPPSGSKVPTGVREALVRGLGPDPALRWPSMQALLDVLDQELAPAPPRRTWVAGLGVLFGATAVASAYWVTRDEPCDDVGRRLDAVWSSARAQPAREAFVATELPYAEEAWDRVQEGLDGYAIDWAAMRVDACEAVHVRQEQSPELMDLRMACLDRRLDELEALVQVLESADAEITEGATVAVEGLRPLDRCADVEALQAAVAPPEDEGTAEAVAVVRAEIDRARALRFSGRVDDALDLVRRSTAGVGSLDYAPLQAEVDLALGSSLESVGEYPGAEMSYEEALYGALASGHDEVAVEAATELVGLVGHHLSRHDDAFRWGRQARALVARTGDGWNREASLLSALGSTYEDAARYEQAREHRERALAIRQTQLGPDALEVAQTLANLGGTAQSLGQFELARGHHERALASAEAALGPHHPQLRQYLNHLGVVLDDLGEYEGALQVYGRALDVSEPSLGEEHPGVATVRTNIGVTLMNLGRYDEALESHRRALASWMRIVGPDHANVASSHNNLAIAYMKLGKYELAHKSLAQATEVSTAVYGPEHPHVADTLVNEGSLLNELGDVEASRDRLQRAIRIYETIKGPQHPALAKPLLVLSTVADFEGQKDESIRLLQRAAEVAEDGDPHAAAGVHFALAQALVDAERDRDLARVHADRARAAWASGVADEDAIVEVDAWISDHFGG